MRKELKEEKGSVSVSLRTYERLTLVYRQITRMAYLYLFPTHIPPETALVRISVDDSHEVHQQGPVQDYSESTPITNV